MADGSGESDDPAEDSAGGTTCPECGTALPAGARFCPECVTAIDGAGAAVDISELDGDAFTDGPTPLLVEDDAGVRRASGRVRVLAGLAVSVPLAPLVLFLVGSVVSLSVWTAALVFLGGWLGPAAVLSRARVPVEAFGHSLYLIAVATLLVPVALAAGGVEAWGESLSLPFDVLAAVSLAVATVLVVLGTFVTNQARKRVTGERRGFERYRDE